MKRTLEALIVSGKVEMTLPNFEMASLKNVADRVICFTREEEKQMFDTLKKQYNNTKSEADWEMLHYFVIQSSLGLRPAEFMFMPIKEVNFTDSKVVVRYGENGVTKNGVTRTLPIGGNVYRSFNLLVRRRLEHLLKGTYIEELGKPMAIGLLTREEVGKKFLIKFLLEKYMNPQIARSPITSLSKKKIQVRWNNMKRDLGWIDDELYKNYIPYGLRHTVASRLAGERGFNAHQLMSFMGHTNIATSMKYVHLDTEHLADAVNIGNESLKV